jgi:hypothetical protein
VAQRFAVQGREDRSLGFVLFMPYNGKRKTERPRRNMPLSGEAIRLMNYIDDVAVTLRRVLATVPTLTPEERAKVAEHLLKTRPNAEDVAQALAAK